MLKRVFGGIIYRAEYRALVCKAHFDFRGMDVHIDKTRCGGYIEHAVRELADHYRILYASLRAAEAVPDFTSLPLTKKNCILRFGRDFVGFETSPLIFTDSKL